MQASKAKKLYNKLKNFWGILWHGHTWEHGYKGERYVKKLTSSVVEPCMYYRASWMPVLKDGWKRPTFEDFISMYDIVLEGIK